MKHSSIIIVLTVMLGSLVSCYWNPYDEKLAEIDSLTQSSPDNAITLLSDIDVAEFSSANRFYYDLLCLKAVDKAGYTIPSDSGVADIVSYFETHDERKLPEVYYYAAKAYQGMGDAPQAIAYFQKVLDQPLDSTNKLLSNALYHSGLIFRKQFLREASVDMFERSYRCDSIRKDTIAMIDNLQMIAYALGVNHDTPELMDSVVLFYNKAKNLADDSNNDKERYKCNLFLSATYSNNGNFELAKVFLDSAENHINHNNIFPEKNLYYYTKAQLTFKKKDFKTADTLCRSLLKSEDISQRKIALYYLSLIAATHHNVEDIDHYLPKFMEVTDSIDLITASEATANANALYNYQLRERDNLRLQAESQSRLYVIAFLFVLTIALALAFFVYRLKREKERRIAQAQIARLKQYEKQINLQKVNSDARNNLITSEAYQMLKEKLKEEKVLKPSDMKVIDETVNTIVKGFKETLFSTYPLSQHEYYICLLLKYGFLNSEISLLLGRSSNGISMARKRLFLKLFGKDGSAAELDDYIRSL